MNVRPATLDDIPAFFEHMQRHFRESGKDGDLIFHPVIDFEDWIKEEQIAGMLKSWSAPLSEIGWQRVWVAEIGGEILGDVMLRSSMMQVTAHRCQYGIGIERSARGQGLGRRLSVQAIAWARQQQQFDWMDLWVFAKNKPAIALYEKLGFTGVDMVKDQFRVMGEKIDDIHMTLSLRR